MAFQVVTPVKLGQAAIAITLATLYTTPALTRTFVKDIDIGNTTAAAVSVSVYLVPSGGSSTSATILVPAVSIPANSIFQWTGTQILNAGDFIQTIASAVGCTINASGAEAI